MARVKTISEEQLGERIDAAKAHAWKLLAASERELFDFQVHALGGGRYKITPSDAQTEANVTMFVQELAELMAEFSAFPHPPEA